MTTWFDALANEIPKSARTAKRSDLVETLALFISFFGTIVACEEVKRDEKNSLFLMRKQTWLYPAKRRAGAKTAHIIARKYPSFSLSLSFSSKSRMVFP